MNRYTAEGIASDLEGGSQIILFVAPYDTIHNATHRIMEYSDEAYTQARPSLGLVYHESGGILKMFTMRETHKMRGSAPDVVVIPQGSAMDFPSRFNPRTEIIEY